MDVLNLVGKVHYLCRVLNYSNSRVHGQGRLGSMSPSRYLVVNQDPSLTPRCLADWDFCYDGDILSMTDDTLFNQLG